MRWIVNEATVPLRADVIIDKAAEEDLASVIDLDILVTGFAKPEFWADNLARAASSKTSRFTVARHQGRIVALILGAVRAWEFGSPPTGWVHAVLVHPDFRQSGIGSRLLAEITQFFQECDVDTIRTMLHIDDKQLMSFFRSHGLSAGPYVELEARIDRFSTPQISRESIE